MHACLNILSHSQNNNDVVYHDESINFYARNPLPLLMICVAW